MKTNVSISIDGETHNKFKEILKRQGITFSFWVERCEKDVLKKKDERRDEK